MRFWQRWELLNLYIYMYSYAYSKGSQVSSFHWINYTTHRVNGFNLSNGWNSRIFSENGSHFIMYYSSEPSIAKWSQNVNITVKVQVNAQSNEQTLTLTYLLLTLLFHSVGIIHGSFDTKSPNGNRFCGTFSKIDEVDFQSKFNHCY